MAVSVKWNLTTSLSKGRKQVETAIFIKSNKLKKLKGKTNDMSTMST